MAWSASYADAEMAFSSLDQQLLASLGPVAAERCLEWVHSSWC